MNAPADPTSPTGSTGPTGPTGPTGSTGSIAATGSADLGGATASASATATPAHGEGAPPAVEVRNLRKHFGGVRAVDGVSFAVQPGEFFFLLGPSGCGKTTLLRILAGLETPDAGAVLAAGREITALPPHRRALPLVFQSYALFPHLTVAENVAFGLVERGVARAEIERRVGAALERVDLPGLERRRPGQLSGGQQQRVVLARALVLEPPVILLDEPLSNLDAKLRAEMRDELIALHGRTGITFLYVTHDQAEALSLADRMAVMQDGRLRAVGAPAALYHRPPDLFCADFLGEANQIPGRVEALEGETLRVATALGAWRVARGVAEGGTGGGAGATVGLRVGEPVMVVIRPEAIQPLPTARGGARPAGSGEGGGEREERNDFAAEIRERRLQGQTMRLTLSALGREGRIELRAAMLSRFAAFGAEPPVRWGFDPDQAVALPTGPAAPDGKEA